MGLAKKDDSTSQHPMYYKENNTPLRETKFYLKPVQATAGKGDKRQESVNVQVVRGKTTTFIHLDDEEAKKVWVHGDAALKKIQQVHKTAIWNFFVGRASIDGVQKMKTSGGGDEINIDKDDNLNFDTSNPRSWSEESLSLIRTYLKALQFSCDGFVVLFCVKNESQTGDVDYDEMAWELEKCLTYHFIAQSSGKSQMVMNEEATMARRGLDPVSRKTKSSGRNKAGFCVYIAYQLFDTVTHNQMVGEALNQCVDITIKRKQLLQSLTEAKIPPQIDEKVRKSIKEVKEFMSQDKLQLVFKLKELKDPQCVEMLAQFMQYLMQNQQSSTGGTGKRNSKSSSFMGLPQFIAFLNQSSEINPIGSSNDSPRIDGNGSTYARSRVGGAQGSTAGTYTALPRPRNSSSAGGKRKSSFSSQFTESRLSSQSMTPPETPRSGTGPRMINSVDSKHHELRIETSLASIQSSGNNSQLSTPDTLRRTDNNRKLGKDERNGTTLRNGDRAPKMMSNSTSKLPKRTNSLREPAISTSSPSPRQMRSGIAAPRSMSSTNPRKPPSHLLSNVEQNSPRGTKGTDSSESTMTAAYTTLGNKTSKHGTNSEYLLIKPKHVHSGPSSLSPRGRDYRQTQGSPRISEDARHGRTNGHRQRAGSATPSIQSTISSSGGGKDSPSRSITSKSSNSRNTPTSGKMITREDLRRMNRSTPSTKKERQPTSFSRTSIPMS